MTRLLYIPLYHCGIAAISAELVAGTYEKLSLSFGENREYGAWQRPDDMLDSLRCGKSTESGVASSEE